MYSAKYFEDEMSSGKLFKVIYEEKLLMLIRLFVLIGVNSYNLNTI